MIDSDADSSTASQSCSGRSSHTIKAGSSVTKAVVTTTYGNDLRRPVLTALQVARYGPARDSTDSPTDHLPKSAAPHESRSDLFRTAPTQLDPNIHDHHNELSGVFFRPRQHTVSAPHGSVVASNIKLTVTSQAANTLNTDLGVSTFTANQNFGIVTLTIAVKS